MDLNHTRLPIPPYLHIMFHVFTRVKLPRRAAKLIRKHPFFECLAIIAPARRVVKRNYREMQLRFVLQPEEYKSENQANRQPPVSGCP